MDKKEFKVWDEENKKWIDDFYVTPDGDVYQYDEIRWSGGWNKLEKFKLTQYIGLKDKKGKKIYEGDIVKIPYYGKQKIVVVNFAFKVSRIREEKKATFECFPFNSYFQEEDGYGEPCESEVIGNIHQNPELLK